MKKDKSKNQKGYAMLFTIIIVSVISVITAGLSSIAYKQLTLSSLAKDSQVATVWADNANECALFFHQRVFLSYSENYEEHKTWNCGGHDLEITWSSKGDTSSGDEGDEVSVWKYSLASEESQTNTPCFTVEVEETEKIGSSSSSSKDVVIISKGYNVCDTNHIRSVERSYEIRYSGQYLPKATDNE